MVVDLPLPVAPVTSTRPCGRRANASTAGGRPRSAQVRIRPGDEPVHASHGPALGEQVAAEARVGAEAERAIELAGLFEPQQLRRREQAARQRLRLFGREHRQSSGRSGHQRAPRGRPAVR